jgi:hypothetical protein
MSSDQTSGNQPTLLAAFQSTDDDSEGLCAFLHVFKPISLAQKALEGENISLVPLAVHHLCVELEACQVIADPKTERDLSILIDKMLEDFNSRWMHVAIDQSQHKEQETT